MGEPARQDRGSERVVVDATRVDSRRRAMQTPMSPCPGRGSRTLALATALATLVASLAVAAPAHAQDRGPRGTTEEITFRSEAVAQRRGYIAWLPPDYVEGTRRYPVVYLLHGLGGGPRDWFRYARVDRVLERLLAEGAVEPVILIAPDGGNEYWTDHVPSKTRRGPQRWGAFVAEDLVREVDERFRTLPGARALVGASMGGHGAVSLALMYPDRFVAAVSLAGALFPEPPTHRAVYKRVWGDPPDAERWAATSPIELMKRLEPGPGVPGLYLHCGDDDRLGFLDYALLAHRILSERKIPHELRVTDGGHVWSVWAETTADWLGFLNQRW